MKRWELLGLLVVIGGVGRCVGQGELLTRTWRVPADLPNLLEDFPGGEEEAAADPFAGEGGGGVVCRYSRPIVDVLQEFGVEFPPGSSIRFSRVRGELVMTNTAVNLREVEHLINKLGPLKLWVLDEKLFRSLEPDWTAEERKKIAARNRNSRVLRETIIPMMDFEDVTVKEAGEFLQEQLRQWNPEAGELKFEILDPPPANPGREDDIRFRNVERVRVKELKLQEVSIYTALCYIFDSSWVVFRIDDEGVKIGAIGDDRLTHTERRAWHIDPQVMEVFYDSMNDPDVGEPDSFGGGEPAVPEVDPRERKLRDLLMECGIYFPPGSSVVYDAEKARLEVINTEANHDLVDRLFESIALDLSRKRALGEK